MMDPFTAKKLQRQLDNNEKMTCEELIRGVLSDFESGYFQNCEKLMVIAIDRNIENKLDSMTIYNVGMSSVYEQVGFLDRARIRVWTIATEDA